MAGTPEQQALVALQHELAQSRAQVLAVTQRLDQLTQSHQLLNSEADRLFREKADQISTLETRLSATLFKQGFDLLDLKSMRPERFDGKRNEAWKPWQRKFKAYCNGKAQGFRSALEWAELQPGPLQGNLHGCPWPKVVEADAKLHDFLCATLGGEAGLIAETVGLEGQGFEVWRRLSAKYAPTGGQFESNTLIQLFNPKAAKDLSALPGAIAKFEHGFRQYEKRSGEVFPEKCKIASLVQIMPKTQATDLKWRFATGLNSYSSMVEQIEQYGQFHRHESAYGRGEADDRMVDALAHEDWLSTASGAEVASFYEGLSAGLDPDCSAAPEPNANDEPLDALFKKGKGKGKGKRGGKGSGGPASSGGQGGGQGGGKAGDGKGKETRTCNHCQIKGHIERDCRKRLAGEPAKARPARSLEQGQQHLDQLNDQGWVQAADRGIGSLDRACGVLDFELDANEFQQSEWIPEVLSPTPAPAPAAAPARATATLTGPLLFPADFADEPEPAVDPWISASADPWSRQASVLTSAAASVTDSVAPLSAEFARQNAELMASRLDVALLFSQSSPPPTFVPLGAGTAEAELLPMRSKRSAAVVEHSIHTPSPQPSRSAWRRRPCRDAATSPAAPAGDRRPDARYMAPELLPTMADTGGNGGFGGSGGTRSVSNSIFHMHKISRILTIVLPVKIFVTFLYVPVKPLNFILISHIPHGRCLLVVVPKSLNAQF